MKAPSLLEMLGIGLTPADVVMPTGGLYKHIPWEAPQAYLHTIFNPADSALLTRVAEALSIPQQWQLFLLTQNGADIFFDSIYLYGITEPDRLMDRRSGVRFPYSIEDANTESRLYPYDEWLLIGGYGHLGSKVLLSRTNGSVQVTKSSGEQILQSWTSYKEWLENELSRLSTLFNSEGRLLVDGGFTDPSHAQIQRN